MLILVWNTSETFMKNNHCGSLRPKTDNIDNDNLDIYSTFLHKLVSQHFTSYTIIPGQWAN